MCLFLQIDLDLCWMVVGIVQCGWVHCFEHCSCLSKPSIRSSSTKCIWPVWEFRLGPKIGRRDYTKGCHRSWRKLCKSPRNQPNKGYGPQVHNIICLLASQATGSYQVSPSECEWNNVEVLRYYGFLFVCHHHMYILIGDLLRNFMWSFLLLILNHVVLLNVGIQGSN